MKEIIEDLKIDDLVAETTPPHQRHSRTSVAAARAIEPKFTGIVQQVWSYLKANPEGATDEELQIRLFLDGNSERPARITLVKKGLVVDSGTEHTGRSGRKAVVWKAL